MSVEELDSFAVDDADPVSEFRILHVQCILDWEKGPSLLLLLTFSRKNWVVSPLRAECLF